MHSNTETKQKNEKVKKASILGHKYDKSIGSYLHYSGLRVCGTAGAIPLLTESKLQDICAEHVTPLV